jgi:hypothetical protein
MIRYTNGVQLLINIAEIKSVFKIKKNRLIQKDIQKEHEKGLTNFLPVTSLNFLGKFRM